MYIHLNKNWTDFLWNSTVILPLLCEVRNLQGLLIGEMKSLGFDLQNEAVLETISIEAVETSKIEGEILDMEEVRSSIARRLGMDLQAETLSSRNVEGVVEMLLDATQNYTEDLNDDRLFGWHSCLFPSGRSGMHKIDVGMYRTDSEGPMRVTSSRMSKPKIYYVAPNAERLEKEMGEFLAWFNGDQNLDPVLKAAIAHFWFISIHPMDDGNGRMARALTDLLLARSDNSEQRFYSMAQQIQLNKKAYYKILENVQNQREDFNEWVVWFLECLKKSLIQTKVNLDKVLAKARFWNHHQKTTFNDRQRKVINLLHGNFEGKLNTPKWVKLCKCSPATALRDVTELIEKGALETEKAKGKSTTYVLVRV